MSLVTGTPLSASNETISTLIQVCFPLTASLLPLTAVALYPSVIAGGWYPRLLPPPVPLQLFTLFEVQLSSSRTPHVPVTVAQPGSSFLASDKEIRIPDLLAKRSLANTSSSC